MKHKASLINIIVCIICCVSISKGQTDNNWKKLADVVISTEQDEAGFEMEVPVFGPEAKALDGQSISLKGYMVPLEELTGHRYFVLSAYPFNMCFFCGMAGPETVVEVYSNRKIDYTSDKITIKGTLHLNEDDADHLMYIMKDAELID